MNIRGRVSIKIVIPPTMQLELRDLAKFYAAAADLVSGKKPSQSLMHYSYVLYPKKGLKVEERKADAAMNLNAIVSSALEKFVLSSALRTMHSKLAARAGHYVSKPVTMYEATAMLTTNIEIAARMLMSVLKLNNTFKEAFLAHTTSDIFQTTAKNAIIRL
jgi:hypothetical protein